LETIEFVSELLCLIWVEKSSDNIGCLDELFDIFLGGVVIENEEGRVE